jgi:hypothetical protein
MTWFTSGENSKVNQSSQHESVELAINQTGTTAFPGRLQEVCGYRFKPESKRKNPVCAGLFPELKKDIFDMPLLLNQNLAFDLSGVNPSNIKLPFSSWSTADCLLAAIRQCIQAGWHDPPERVLASMIGRTVRTVQRLQAQLVAAGRLSITHRKIGPRENDTNVYAVIGGGGDTDVREVLKTNTNTKASRPASTFPSKLRNENDGLKTRVRWAEGKLAGATARLERIEGENAQLKQKVEFFRGYCQRGEQIANATGWLRRKKEQDARIRMEASVGSYRPQPPEEEVRQAQEYALDAGYGEWVGQQVGMALERISGDEQDRRVEEILREKGADPQWRRMPRDEVRRQCAMQVMCKEIRESLRLPGFDEWMENLLVPHQADSECPTWLSRGRNPELGRGSRMTA